MKNIKIPKKYSNIIQSYWEDEDGIWVVLKEGFLSKLDDSHMIHEYSKKDIRERLKFVCECYCNDCKEV